MNRSLHFLHDFGARRLASYDPQPELLGTDSYAGSGEADPDEVIWDYEVDADQWVAIPVTAKQFCLSDTWVERPRRFVDGKDVGRTVAWLRASGGYPIPVRLSEIGATAVRVVDGVCQRECEAVERVVSMVVDPFPWERVEAFAEALQGYTFRLLSAMKPGGKLSYDFEVMRKATENRSNTEMGVLEEAMLSRAHHEPSIVDGRLEPRAGGFDQGASPVAGVIKTHRKSYLHAKGMQLLYQLAAGERTPIFSLPHANLPVVSWYVRLAGNPSAMPNWGLIRVELPLKWFGRRTDRSEYANRLSRLLCEYRSRDSGYDRAPVSLHPIVRAEQLLGALFTPSNALVHRFYYLTHL